MEPGGRSGAVFWFGSAAGAAIVAYGLRGMAVFEPRGAPSALRWLIGSALVVDLLVIPVVGLVGWGLRRAIPATVWPVVRTALIVSGVLVLFALPLVTDQGGTPGNASVRPRNYAEGLTVALVWTWVIAGSWLLARRVATSTPVGVVVDPRSCEHGAMDDSDRGPGATGALPSHQRPVDDRPLHTADLPDTPTRDRSIPARAWVEAPAELLALDDARYLRRVGPWLLWRAGDARGPATYWTCRVDRFTDQYTFDLFADGTGAGRGPSSHHTRFRTWKEDLRDHA